MTPGARRLPDRFWRRAARRALLAACLWLALPGLTVAQQITAAQYIEPTSAYPHGVLGDDEEWGAVLVTIKPPDAKKDRLLGKKPELTYRIAARARSVFEDVAPRLWDITGDGTPELVVVESHQDKGARLVIFGLIDGVPEQIAATGHIGQRFRWLAPVGAADFNGDGHIEVAFIDRPHLARTLRVWQYSNREFGEIAVMSGLSNHNIGEDFITGGVRDCGKGPEMVLVSGDWRDVVAVTLDDHRLRSRRLGRHRDDKHLNKALECGY